MNASVRLILTMLKVTLIDGPSVYGSVHSAIKDIERILANEPEGLTLGKLDSILRENNVDAEEIEATYVGNH
jgi:hypothetical protein